MDFTGGDGVDRYGHGTHVAAIIAGQAGRTVETRELQGVAPGAYLVNLRVLGDDGSGVISSVIEAIDWAIEHKAQYRIGVINLSLGAPVLQPYRDDPMCEAVERAVRAGIVVVAAAGNFGRRPERAARCSAASPRPATIPYVLTVGAIDTQGTPERSDDVVAAYSSRGPTLYDLVMKPDVMAPGSRIVSAEAAGSVVAREHPERHVTGVGANGYIQFSGTSMAAGRRQRRGGAAAAERSAPDAGGCQGGDPVDQLVHAVGRAARQRRRQPERAGGGRPSWPAGTRSCRRRRSPTNGLRRAACRRSVFPLRRPAWSARPGSAAATAERVRRFVVGEPAFGLRTVRRHSTQSREPLRELKDPAAAALRRLPESTALGQGAVTRASALPISLPSRDLAGHHLRRPLPGLHDELRPRIFPLPSRQGRLTRMPWLSCSQRGCRWTLSRRHTS